MPSESPRSSTSSMESREDMSSKGDRDESRRGSKSSRYSRRADGAVDLESDYNGEFADENMIIYFEEEEEPYRPPLLTPNDAVLFHTDVDEIKPSHIPAAAWGGDILKELDARLFEVVPSDDRYEVEEKPEETQENNSANNPQVLLEAYSASEEELSSSKPPENGLDNKTFLTLMQLMKKIPSSSNLNNSNQGSDDTSKQNQAGNQSQPQQPQQQQNMGVPTIMLTVDGEEDNYDNEDPSMKRAPSISIVLTNADGENDGEKQDGSGSPNNEEEEEEDDENPAAANEDGGMTSPSGKSKKKEERLDLVIMLSKEDSLADELVEKKAMVLYAKSDMMCVKEETDVYWNHVLKLERSILEALAETIILIQLLSAQTHLPSDLVTQVQNVSNVCKAYANMWSLQAHAPVNPVAVHMAGFDAQEGSKQSVLAGAGKKSKEGDNDDTISEAESKSRRSSVAGEGRRASVARMNAMLNAAAVAVATVSAIAETSNSRPGSSSNRRSSSAGASALAAAAAAATAKAAQQIRSEAIKSRANGSDMLSISETLVRVATNAPPPLVNANGTPVNASGTVSSGSILNTSNMQQSNASITLGGSIYMDPQALLYARKSMVSSAMETLQALANGTSTMNLNMNNNGNGRGYHGVGSHYSMASNMVH
ncbi:hypothetical protein HDV05_006508 [Chytridiales sp. JEL 0842]|nr:hypothetical protein HDV05_006508 [Chytridiales sp. JEL 0842]